MTQHPNKSRSHAHLNIRKYKIKVTDTTAPIKVKHKSEPINITRTTLHPRTWRPHTLLKVRGDDFAFRIKDTSKKMSATSSYPALSMCPFKGRVKCQCFSPLCPRIISGFSNTSHPAVSMCILEGRVDCLHVVTFLFDTTNRRAMNVSHRDVVTFLFDSHK